MDQNPIVLETFGATGRTRLGNELARLGLQWVRRIREKVLGYEFNVCKSQPARGAVWDHRCVQEKSPVGAVSLKHCTDTQSVKGKKQPNKLIYLDMA